jgi:uncharacterized membrane protein
MSDQMKTPRKWTKVLLIVSVALNACFIGLIIGVKLTQDGMRPQRAPSAQGSLYLRALSHEDRRALGRVMRNYHTREMRQMDRAGYENALVLLRATPFDPEALEDLMEHQTEASEERLEYAREALIAHLSEMSNAKRAKFADALEHALERGPKRKKKP